MRAMLYKVNGHEVEVRRCNPDLPEIYCETASIPIAVAKLLIFISNPIDSDCRFKKMTVDGAEIEFIYSA